MKTKIFLLLGALASMTFLSCNKDENPVVTEEPNQITLVLRNEPIPPAQPTKTHLAEDGITPLWDGDEFIDLTNCDNAFSSRLFISSFAGKPYADITQYMDPSESKFSLAVLPEKPIDPQQMKYERYIQKYNLQKRFPELTKISYLVHLNERISSMTWNHPIQNPSDIGQYDPSFDFLIGEPFFINDLKKDESSNRIINIKLKRLTSVVKINLIDQTTDKKLQDKKILDGHFWTTQGADLGGERFYNIDAEMIEIDALKILKELKPGYQIDDNIRGVNFEMKSVNKQGDKINLDYPTSEPFLLMTFPIEKGSWDPAAELKLDVNLSGNLCIHFSKKFADADSFWLVQGKLNTININVTDAMLEQQQ